MIRYYDRQGQPITDTLVWAKLFEDQAYKRIAETTLADGRWVSTVWLGLNHNYGTGPPLIFKSMVFPSQDNMNELDCERYSTEEEAKDGHRKLAEKWSEPMRDEG